MLLFTIYKLVGSSKVVKVFEQMLNIKTMNRQMLVVLCALPLNDIPFSIRVNSFRSTLVCTRVDINFSTFDNSSYAANEISVSQICFSLST